MAMDLFMMTMVPFWIAMVFINGKLILEMNREWNMQKMGKEAKEVKNDM